MRRRELFPADHGLQTRMVIAAVVTPLFTVAALALLATLLRGNVLIGMALCVAVGLWAVVKARRERPASVALTREEDPQLHAMVDRLSLLADIAAPALVLEADSQPNSWVIDLPGRRPHLHVTEGLLDALSDSELEAVLAHELCHIVHRDATVMSVVGLPGAVLSEGAGRVGSVSWWPLMLGALVIRLVAGLTAVGTKALSRYRETAADAAAARLTGTPTALASALLKVSGQLTVIPSEDARAAAARNAFNLLPVRVDDDDWWHRLARSRAFARVTDTHPTVQQRVAALEELEHRLHRARPSSFWLDAT